MAFHLATPLVARPALKLAPPWHTATLIGLICSVAAAGAVLQRVGVNQADARLIPRTPTLALYLPVLLANGMLVLYVSRIGRGQNALRELIGRRWDTLTRAVFDVALALTLCGVIQAFEVFTVRYLGAPSAGRNAAALALFPRTGAERLTWCLVAGSVGFSEEVVYRGYLLTQLSAFTHRESAGLVLQAVLFGVAHADQGGAVAARVAVYGLMLGVAARARRSVLPGVICHAAIDVASGWLP